MIEKTSTKFCFLMAVLVPYFILLGYTIGIYPDLPEKLENDLPRVMVFLPAFFTVMLPATYGGMVFFFNHYLKRVHYLVVAAFMDLGILGMIGAVYLIKDSSI